MKSAAILSCMLIFSLSVFSQQLTPDIRYERLMKKSRHKQTGGIIFLSVGAAVTAGGILMIADGVHRHSNNNNYDIGFSDGEAEQIAGVLVTGLGIGSMCTSIPFFVGAHRARKKAMAISLKKEGVSLLYKSGFSTHFYPALAVRIPLGR